MVVPDHSELDTGTLRSILRQAGIPLDQLSSLLYKRGKRNAELSSTNRCGLGHDFFEHFRGKIA